MAWPSIFCKILSGFFLCVVCLHVRPAKAEPLNAQPAKKVDVHFKKSQIMLAGKAIDVELAENEDQREKGLMFRDSLPANEGMLFIFEGESVLRFWMKNTFIDLAIGYFDKNQTLVDVQEMKKMSSVMDQNLPNYPSSAPAMYALEMNKGWFTKNKVKVGARFELNGGPKSRSKPQPRQTTK